MLKRYALIKVEYFMQPSLYRPLLARTLKEEKSSHFDGSSLSGLEART
jgi:hypothetical protein